MLSFPIPYEVDNNSTEKYTLCNLKYDKKTYQKILEEIKPACVKDMKGKTIHLDPDIRKNVIDERNPEWTAVFGQRDAAETHLRNKLGANYKDTLFLFFGWFRQVECNLEEEYHYIKNKKGFHAIYGYLQVGEKVTGKDMERYKWHPHYCYEEPNAMYVANKKLIINGKETDLPGYGCFKYDKELKLTKEGMSRSIWKLPEAFKNVEEISYHTAPYDLDHFKSARIGQEFVITEKEGSTAVCEWAKKLIENHIDKNS